MRGGVLSPYFVRYDSTNDRARLQDVTETLRKDKQLQELLDAGPLDVLTHSTGALVFRKWLFEYEDHRIPNIGNVVMLAPANFGSPLAQTGKSPWGRIYVTIMGPGHKRLADAGESGEGFLTALEPGSEVQWRLAETDLLPWKQDSLYRTESLYGASGIRLSIITGAKPYGGFRKLINRDGTDGTIVVAGANLDARKATITVAEEPAIHVQRSTSNPPFAIHSDLDHGSVLDLGKNDTLQNQVIGALSGSVPYEELRDKFAGFTRDQKQDIPGHKQLLFRLTDQHRVPTPECKLKFEVRERAAVRGRVIPGPEPQDGRERDKTKEVKKLFEKNRHVHKDSPHFVRYLVNTDDISRILADKYVLALRAMTDTGDKKIRYASNDRGIVLFEPERGETDDQIDLLRRDSTTLVDVRLERENSLASVIPPSAAD